MDVYEGDRHICSNCTKRPADVYCLRCCAYLCARCDAVFHKKDQFRHKRVGVTPVYFTHSEMRPQAFHCAQHVQIKDGLSYCAICHMLCCKECASGSQHTSHNMIPCTDDHCIGAITDAVWERLTGLEAKIDKGPTQRNDIAMIKKELNRASEETYRLIEERFNNLHLILSERELALKEEIAAITAKLSAKLSMQEKACNSAMDDAKFALLNAQRFVQFREPPREETESASSHVDSDAKKPQESVDATKKTQSENATSKPAPEKPADGDKKQPTAAESEKTAAAGTTDSQKTTDKKESEEGEKEEQKSKSLEKYGVPNTPEAIGALLNVLHMLQDADVNLRDMYRVKPGISTPFLRLRGEEQFQQYCNAARTLYSVTAEMPPLSLMVQPTGGVWWNALALEWVVDRSCAAFMKLHSDAQYELQMRPPSETEFRTIYRGPETVHKVGDLLPQTTYDFRCRMYLTTGETSAYCSVLNVTTSTPPNTWKLKEGPRYMLDTSRMIVTKTSKAKECWDATVIANVPLIPHTVHRWSVGLRALHAPTSSLLIGVAPATIDQTQIDNGNKCGWYVSSLWSGSTQPTGDRVTFGLPTLKASDTVGIIFDAKGDKGVLSFFTPERGWCVGHKDIPLDAPLVPCVILSEPNDCVEFRIF